MVLYDKIRDAEMFKLADLVEELGDGFVKWSWPQHPRTPRGGFCT